ncbi:hypothetical protein AHAS_Ahas05G0292600 [Arachis hypogaea]
MIGLTFLSRLNLSYNKLSGPIQDGNQFQTFNDPSYTGMTLAYNASSSAEWYYEDVKQVTKIPDMIGDMRSLKSIDLFHNHLCGAILRSMIGLAFLSRLKLSYNNLSGPIPYGNQFQTFNDLSYTDNQYLCIAPLPQYCPSDGPRYIPIFEGYDDEDRENDKLDKALFYSITSLGFATYFWRIIRILYFKKNRRYFCFRYVEKLTDRIYVAVVLKVVKLKKMI